MSDPIDRAVIQHVAQLASLSLTDAEAEKMTREIASILAYVGELATLDTSNVPPTANVTPVTAKEPGSALRADDVQPGLSHADALSQAPRSAEGGFAVPGFVESEE